MTEDGSTASPGLSEKPGLVVGVDGSESGRHALAWAAEAADAQGLTLTLVHARPDDAAPVRVSDAGDEVDATLSEAAATARQAFPDLVVREVQHPGSPVEALLDIAHGAELVVLGSRGLGGFAGLLLGSTPTHVVPHATCPVVVVRSGDVEPGPHAGAVVLAFDGSPAATAAAAFALRHAAATERPLVVVEATSREPDPALPAEVASLAAAYPGVAVEHVVVHGRAAAAVVEHGAGADLIVLGSRGRGGFRGLLMGSVSQQVIRHASGPVAVVRAVEPEQ